MAGSSGKDGGEGQPSGGEYDRGNRDVFAQEVAEISEYDAKQEREATRDFFTDLAVSAFSPVPGITVAGPMIAQAVGDFFADLGFEGRNTNVPGPDGRYGHTSLIDRLGETRGGRDTPFIDSSHTPAEEPAPAGRLHISSGLGDIRAELNYLLRQVDLGHYQV